MENENQNEKQNIREQINRLWEDLPKVENMTSDKGNDIPNQFIIRWKGGTLFQSYNSPIALELNGQTYIFKNYDYSVTTGKYRNQFLEETLKETRAKLKSGEYIAVDFDVWNL